MERAPARLGLVGKSRFAPGFSRDYAWMKFSREAAAVSAPSELRVVRVGREHAAAFGHVTTTAFGAPAWMADWVAALPVRNGWACYLSFAGDEPVGAGAVYFDGHAAWLGFGATLPEHRGRGSQSAIFAARITEACGSAAAASSSPRPESRSTACRPTPAATSCVPA